MVKLTGKKFMINIGQQYINMDDEGILLKLNRQYSEDESFQFLFKFIKHLKFTIGELKSEVSELQDDCKGYQKYKRDLELQETNLQLSKRIKTLEKDLKHYQNLYFNQLTKIKYQNEKQEINQTCQKT